MHKALLDISSNLVHLDSPMTGKVTLHLSVMAHLQASVHAVVVKSLEEIPIIQDVTPTCYKNKIFVQIEMHIKL
jgi:hypothetical protein